MRLGEQVPFVFVWRSRFEFFVLGFCVAGGMLEKTPEVQ
jgi:hypothetical protein